MSPILTLILSEGNKKFGSFANLKFDSSEMWHSDPDAFLFSLSNEEKLTIINPKKAFYTNLSETIIIFGSGYDLKIENDCDKGNNCFSKLGTTYKLPKDMDKIQA
jgi:hypothetical protein